MPKVLQVSPEAVFPGQLSYNKTISETVINMIDSNFFDLAGKSPAAGRLFKANDAKKIIISSTVANLFNLPGESAIGKTVQLVAYLPDPKKVGVTNDMQLGSDFEIIGVVDDSSAGGDIYVLADTVPLVTITDYQYAKVKVQSTDDMEAVRDSLINKGFVVSSLSDIVRQANQIFSIIQISLGIFGVFALIVAAIGLVNTMTISLLERTNEIGIMRAIGATPLDIKKIFIGESVIIGFLGGMFGIILGVVGSQILNWLFNILVTALGGHGTNLFSYPAWFIIFIIGVSTFVGLVGGIWPAYRAGNLNPLQALRYK
jgi:putative ABC transport system permease protein